MIRAEIASFIGLALAGAVFLVGVGLLATAQAQEAVANSEGLRIRQPNRWLTVPAITVISAALVLVLVVFEHPHSRTLPLRHFLLFFLLAVGLFMFLAVQMGIGRFYIGETTTEVRTWVYFGFLGPLGANPTSPEANYSALAYLMAYGIILGTLTLVWSLLKPDEFTRFIKTISAPLRA